MEPSLGSPWRSSRFSLARPRHSPPNRPNSAYRRSAEATRDPSVRLWATDGTADWLLWRIPDLRGRIAYDVRFELYDQATLDRIVGYGSRTGDWRRSLAGYRVVVVDERRHLAALAAEPGARVTYRDDDIAVVARR